LPARWRCSPALANSPTLKSVGLVKAIDDVGQLDNTLIFYIVGDNGASAEGSLQGLFNEYTFFNRIPENVSDILKHYDELGARAPFATMPPAGLWPVTRHSPGPRWLRRTMAARGTEWQSIGRRE